RLFLSTYLTGVITKVNLRVSRAVRIRQGVTEPQVAVVLEVLVEARGAVLVAVLVMAAALAEAGRSHLCQIARYSCTMKISYVEHLSWENAMSSEPTSDYYIQVLDIVKADDWDKAHHVVQSRSDKKACLIHAYLHRVEVDMSNARYWYRQAGETMPNNTLEEELDRLYRLM
ncbi:MAG: hypothetical protein WBA57_16550, partial [Elainellaceae cyanobacterium]